MSPVIVTRGNVVIDGRRRVLIARKLGISVPVVRLDVEIENCDPNILSVVKIK